MKPYTETHTVTDARGSYTVATVEGYDLRTGGDKIAELTAQVDALNKAREQMAAQLRELSEQLQAVRA